VSATPAPLIRTESGPLRLAALLVVLSGALALGSAGLIALPVCLLSMVLVLIGGLVVPRWIPGLVTTSPIRTCVAVAAIGLLVVATAGSGPAALLSGGPSDRLGAAVAELALPQGVPMGLLAALAAGALVAVTLELADRRGTQSALVLGAAVHGLTTVAAPGAHLLPALVLGWPALMFALTRLAATDGSTELRLRSARPRPWVRPTGRGPARSPRAPLMDRSSSTGRTAARVVARWQLLPVVAAIAVGLTVLAGAMFSGAATLTQRTGNFGSGAGPGSRAGGRAASDYLGGEMNLSARGELRPDPLMEVGTDSPRLWRAGTLDLYNGRGWLATVSPAGLPRYVIDAAGNAERQPVLQPRSSSRIRSDQVRPLTPGATQVIAPGLLLGVVSRALEDRGIYVAAGDRLTMSDSQGSSPADPYEVRSQVPPTVRDPDALTLLGTIRGSAPSAGSIDGSTVDEALDPRWTVLPLTVPERVAVLGRSLVTGSPNRLAAVQRIEAELAARMTYTLDSPVPPPGSDAVDDVLFVSHSGFCEQFASAEVVLLRAAGVPARMAVGFSGGEPGDDGFRTVLRSDAHAWVEVWFPGVGWVTSDPTPAAAPTRSWWQPVRDAVRALDPAAWIGVAVLLILVAAFGWSLFRRRSRRVATADPDVRYLDPDLAAAFAGLEAALLAQGRPRAQDETVAALARRLTAENRPGEKALAQALLVLERALYAPRPPSRPECLAAATAIDQQAALEPVASLAPARPC
jgi:hypothetical protein